MSEHLKDLPPEIGTKLMAFLRETNGKFEVADREGFLNFVTEYGQQYPVLLGLVKINQEALVEHFEKTGEVPPGIELIKLTTGEEGDNVTKLEIFRGPTASKS
jgi:hypothetical protein